MTFGSRQFSSNRPTVPVAAGETYTVRIEDLGREGDGIAKVNNFVIFVPGVKVGDEVNIRINKVSSRVAFAEVI